ncbi:hypothetical protein ACFCYX_18300 [Streptomyces populi]|uniref:hypothetical protein n=1 Tax=Streptomyces populi TaxID=2058924 RepID=UPI001F0C7BD4|nr:hypothetical protein [Streptomyces populi]
MIQIYDALVVGVKDGTPRPGHTVGVGGACCDGDFLTGGEPTDPNLHRLVRQANRLVQVKGGRPAVCDVRFMASGAACAGQQDKS